uniref:Uncharacterized protein n=1 Tax=Salix viminalis TaxID=40686 RepID=A0A6N2N6N2_SALVM
MLKFCLLLFCLTLNVVFCKSFILNYCLKYSVAIFNHCLVTVIFVISWNAVALPGATGYCTESCMWRV